MTYVPSSTQTAESGAVASSSVDWPAIFAGSIVAIGVSFVATAFGSAIGLSLASPYHGTSPVLFYIALGIWMLWISVSSFAAGGYVTGRLRRRAEGISQHELDIRDGANGLVVWGIAVVVGAILATASISYAAAKATPEAAKNELYVDRLLRGDGDLKPGGPTVNDATRQVVARIVSEHPTGDFAPEDKTYLSNVLASGTGLPPQQSGERIDAVSGQMKADADKARKVTVMLAFLTASTLAVGAATAFQATRLGGRHRDQNVDLRPFVRTR